MFEQTGTIFGKVNDEASEPLSGANTFVKGKMINMTDAVSTVGVNCTLKVNRLT